MSEYNSEEAIWERLVGVLDPSYRHLFDTHRLTDPNFYTVFEMDTLTASSHNSKASARKICQDIRWEDQAKFSDPVIAYYARLFIAKNPSLRHLFDVKHISHDEMDEICLSEGGADD